MKETIEKLLAAQALIDETPVHAQHRHKLEKAVELLDRVLDDLQPEVKEEKTCCIPTSETPEPSLEDLQACMG